MIGQDYYAYEYYYPLEELPGVIVQEGNQAAEIQSEVKRVEKPKRADTGSRAKRIERLIKAGFHCEMCGCGSSKEIRRGPNGNNTLCNTCGLLWARLQKLSKPSESVTSALTLRKKINKQV
jgi:hypothetical protein